MAIHSSKLTLQAKWLRGWALMRSGKTSEGYDLLASIKLSDLRGLSDAECPDRVCKRVQSIVERQTRAQAADDDTVMDALVRAAKRGDDEARDLLVFGDLEDLETVE
jgi:hypothetical protein